MIRSALFPGWGQVYTEHYLKAGLIFCCEVGLVISAVREDRKARDALRTDYGEYLDRLERRNLYMWWTAGVIALSMIDAYVDAHLFGFDEHEVSVRMNPSQRTPDIECVISIPLPDI